jgi:predicted component of type VI protein secretion system
MQSSGSYRLVVRRGPQPNQVFELTKDTMNLGRDITNDIVIGDKELSRHHLRLHIGPSGVTVEDLGSTNGTFVNGRRVSGATPLQHGDLVALGETVTLAFEASAPPATFSPPAASAPAYGPPAQPAYNQPPAYSSPPAGQAAAAGQAPYQPAGPAPQPAQPSPYDAPPRQAPAPGYPPQQVDPYAQPGAQYAADPQAGTYAPPAAPAAYDYDPYGGRQGENNTRWIALGCAGIALMTCSCACVISLVLIDAANLWCSTPIVSGVVRIFGFCATGG